MSKINAEAIAELEELTHEYWLLKNSHPATLADAKSIAKRLGELDREIRERQALGAAGAVGHDQKRPALG